MRGCFPKKTKEEMYYKFDSLVKVYPKYLFTNKNEAEESKYIMN